VYHLKISKTIYKLISQRKTIKCEGMYAVIHSLDINCGFFNKFIIDIIIVDFNIFNYEII